MSWTELDPRWPQKLNTWLQMHDLPHKQGMFDTGSGTNEAVQVVMSDRQLTSLRTLLKDRRIHWDYNAHGLAIEAPNFWKVVIRPEGPQ